MLNLHRLFLLRELAARRTVAAVAETLHYSRSSVSQQLAKLEREAGVKLYEHVGRTLRLTDAGHTLLEHAERLLDQAESAEIDLERSQSTVRGQLQVGVFQTAAVSLLPPAIAWLRDRHPGLQVVAHQMSPEQSVPAVRIGDLDLAVVQSYDHSPLLPLPELFSEVLLRDPVRVALPGNHPLAASGAVQLSRLEHEVWATGEPGTGIGDMATRLCLTQGGFLPDVRYFSSDLAVLQAVVAGGHAVALIPAMARADSHPGVAVRDLQGAALGRDVAVVTRAYREQRRSIQVFVQALQATGPTGAQGRPDDSALLS